MSKSLKNVLICVGVILLVVAGIYRFYAGNYNRMVELDEAVSSQWAQVQNQYQRRMDLIPNLVSTVKGFAAHESDVYTKVAEARSRAGGVVNIDSSVLEDPEKFAEYQKIQNDLGASLQRLLVVSENYPELKADHNFLSLQNELEGTENRISVERKRFNDAVKVYNGFIRQFPRNMIASSGGFLPKQYFTAAADAQSAPKVEF